MSIPNTRERLIRPTHPGEMLREDFLPDYGLTATSLALMLGVSRQTVNELLRERRAISPAMALRLARLFGNTPEFWLTALRAVDLWDAARASQSKLERIQPLGSREYGVRSRCGRFSHCLLRHPVSPTVAPDTAPGGRARGWRPARAGGLPGR